MKILAKILIALNILIQIVIFFSVNIAYAAEDPCTQQASQQNPIIRVKILDPINYAETDNLCWSGTYCQTIPAEFDDKTTQNVQDCQVKDFPYSSGECEKNEGELVLIGKCQLVQIISAKTPTELLQKIIRSIYLWGTGFGSAAAVLVVIVSGIQYIVDGGKGENVGPAKDRIKLALSALVVLFLSGLILYTINPTFFTLE